jgi:NAD-dependent deacetylase
MWFGESIDQEVWKEAVKRSMTCDVMIIAGTSLANTLHFYAKNNQAAIVDINPENTPFSCEIDFSMRQTAVEGLSRLISIFESPF